MSSEQLMSFLVNDILDYAKISAGKFFKYCHKFDIKHSVDEILLIMKNKADQIGIEIETNYTGFSKEDDSTNISSQIIHKIND